MRMHLGCKCFSGVCLVESLESSFNESLSASLLNCQIMIPASKSTRKWILSSGIYTTASYHMKSFKVVERQLSYDTLPLWASEMLFVINANCTSFPLLDQNFEGLSRNTCLRNELWAEKIMQQLIYCNVSWKAAANSRNSDVISMTSKLVTGSFVTTCNCYVFQSIISFYWAQWRKMTEYLCPLTDLWSGS